MYKNNAGTKNTVINDQKEKTWPPSRPDNEATSHIREYWAIKKHFTFLGKVSSVPAPTMLMPRGSAHSWVKNEAVGMIDQILSQPWGQQIF